MLQHPSPVIPCQTERGAAPVLGQLLLTTEEEIRKGLPKLRRSFMLLAGTTGEMFQKKRAALQTEG